MTFWRLVLRSLFFHGRTNAAVALGVAAATAVLTGALLVGDSVRGSLRHLTLDRLGRIDEVLVVDRFFRAELATELESAHEFSEHYQSAAAVILFPNGTVEYKRRPGETKRTSGLLVIGCDDRFWQLGAEHARPNYLPGRDEIVINSELADELGITADEVGQKEGVYLTLRVPKTHAVAGDSPLGEKEDLVSSLPRLKVIDVIPAESLGRFSLQANQVVPKNVFVSLETLGWALEQQGKINAILVAGKSPDSPPDESAGKSLASALRPTFADYGFIMKHARQSFPPAGGDEQVVFDYSSFSTERMLLDDEAANVARHAFHEDHAQPVLTYLANEISKVTSDRETAGIPYSLITAIDVTPQYQPQSALTGKPIEPIADGEIVLNQWAADDLQANVGDKIRVTYFEPETAHGQPTEKSADFVLKDVVALTEPAQPYTRSRAAVYDKAPTLANDPDLTPIVPGVTDQESIDKWELPFELTRPIRRQDDDYWKNHRTTPKAFISLTAGRKLWSSRFGATTSFRIPAANKTAPQLETDFLAAAGRDGANFGFDFIPIKRRGLTASSGTTPFDVLFLALSFFIIAAALMLVALLFRLGIEQRANEIGILLAVGLRRRLTGRLLATEGLIVAAMGGLAGIVAGIAYAWLMIAGLRTWWVGAVATPFLELYVSPKSLAIGYASGVLVSLLTIGVSIFQTRHLPIRRLLAGQATESGNLVRLGATPYGTLLRVLAYVAIVVLAVVAGGLALAATTLGGEAQAGAFVGAGMSILIALLALTWLLLRRESGIGAVTGSLPLPKLAARNAGRNSLRSTITIGLVATASFLIVAMSSFRLAPTEQGVGGFDLLAESSRPIFADLNTAAGRDELLANKADALRGGAVLALRLKPGDDASCNNLYKSTQPRVLGVTDTLIQYFDRADIPAFSWSASAAQTDAQRTNPWHLLEKPTGAAEPVPVVIDKNTAMYSLGLYFGIGEEFDITYDEGATIRFRVAGLLDNSILQGSLLIGEADFVRLFPQVSGYRYFLVKAPPVTDDDVAQEVLQRETAGAKRVAATEVRQELTAKHVEQASAALEEKLGDQGFDATSTEKQLAGLLAVQNTYLSTFQSLGALGLLLGTFGLATVQLRGVLERRQELALLRAVGFQRSRLATMVLLENGVLLFGGLATGIVAALLAVLPHMIFGDASVPWGQLAIMLGVVLGVGFISGLAAVRATLRAPLLSALRGE